MLTDFKVFWKLKYVLFLLLIISCKKENVDIKHDSKEESKNYLGEKSYSVGSYQTTPVKIDVAPDGGYVVAGSASEKEGEEYPFFLSLNDSLQPGFILYPAYSEIQTRTVGFVKLTDGYVLLSTTADSPIENDDGVCLTKISFSGEIIWEKKYFLGAISYGSNITRGINNTIVLACEQEASTPDHRYYSIIARIDGNGELIWNFSIHTEFVNRPETITTDEEDDYVAIIDDITMCDTCRQDLFSVPVVYKIDKNGEILWKKELESDNGRGWTSIAAIDGNNDIVVAHEPGNQIGSFYYNDKLLLKLDNSGQIIWQTMLKNEMFEGRTVNAGGFEQMREIVFDEENNIYVVGNINEDKFFGPRRLAIAKFSPAGEVLKTKIYKDELQYQGVSIHSIPDDRLVVLSMKYFPWEFAVFYINDELEIQ
jgi:outer membrane protein assembly factor BamB